MPKRVSIKMGQEGGRWRRSLHSKVIRLSDSRLEAIRMNYPAAGRLVTFSTHNGGDRKSGKLTKASGPRFTKRPVSMYDLSFQATLFC